MPAVNALPRPLHDGLMTLGTDLEHVAKLLGLFPGLYGSTGRDDFRYGTMTGNVPGKV